MNDAEWKSSVDKDIRDCNETKIRLEERDRQHEKDIKEGKSERMELYDHKNTINNRLAIVETGKVDYKTFNTLSKCVTTLKTEKKFIPYIVMIISALACLGSMVFVVVRLGGH